MGHTHYWGVRDGIELTPAMNERWGVALERAGFVVRECKAGQLIAWESDSDRGPETGDGIRFNGIADEGHETFYLPANVYELTPFEFCKTNHKPYDVVVCAVLAVMAHECGSFLRVWSDGTPSEWRSGLRFARAALQEPIGLPQDREAWAEHFVESYQPTIRAEWEELHAEVWSR